MLVEYGEGEEVVGKEDVVRLHDLFALSATCAPVQPQGRKQLTIMEDMTKAQKAAIGYALTA